jgi:hypothetical protein
VGSPVIVGGLPVGPAFIDNGLPLGPPVVQGGLPLGPAGAGAFLPGLGDARQAPENDQVVAEGKGEKSLLNTMNLLTRYF